MKENIKEIMATIVAIYILCMISIVAGEIMTIKNDVKEIQESVKENSQLLRTLWHIQKK